MKLTSLKSVLSNLATLKVQRTLKVIAGCIVLCCLFAWLAVNPLAQWLVPKLAESQLASHASVKKVSFNPLTLALTIENLVLTEKNGAPLASIDHLMVDLEVSGLMQWAWKLKQIAITGPRIHVSISKQGKLNWADLIAKLNEQPTPPNQPIPRVIIGNIKIVHGDIEYQDAHLATPLRTAMTPLDFTLEGFSTLPEDRGDYLLVAKLPQQGGRLKWKGDLGVNPVASHGTFAIEHLQLPRLLASFTTQTFPMKVHTGHFSGQFNYDFALTQSAAKPEQTQTQLSLHDMLLSLNDLKCTLPHGEQLLFDTLSLTSEALEVEQHTQWTLHTNNLALALNNLELHLKKLEQHTAQTNFSIASAKIDVPELVFNQDKASQLRFDHLNAQVNQTQLSHAQQSLFTLPKLDIHRVRFNLAEQQASVASILLDNGQISASHDAAGILNWQQMFSSINDTQTATDAPSAATASPTSSPKSAKSDLKPPFHFSVGELALAHWQLHYASQQFAKPWQAHMDDLNLHLSADNQTGLRVKNIELAAGPLHLQANQQPLLDLNRLVLNQGQVTLHPHKVEAAAIRLSGLKTAVIRQADQRLNWQALFTSTAHATTAGALEKTTPRQAAQVATASTAPQQINWAYALKHLSVESAAIHIEDKSTETPVVLDIDGGHVDIADLSPHLARALPVSAGFTIKQGGQFNMQGKLAVMPLKADFECALKNVALRPFSPYLQQFSLLKVESGDVNLQGMVQINANGSNQFLGTLGVHQLSLVDASNQQPFVRWQTLQADALKLSLAPNSLQIGALTLDALRSSFVIYPDQSLNLSKILRKDASTVPPSSTQQSIPAAATEKNQANSDFPINIALVRIKNTELAFADFSLPQPFGTHMHALNGVITGIYSKPNTTAQIELDGKVDDYGAARIRGKLNPFQATENTDLKLAFTNLEMNRLTPYSGKFAGRKIESGKLSVDLDYKIKQRTLQGENKMTIHQLKLGDNVESKGAADLPLDLAIALLEDSRGIIDLDLPVSGSLDDPKFSLGGLVWKALTNVLSKIVTAPFSALGKLFGNSETLDAIVFDSGKSVLLPPELEKLHAVSRALEKRPQLIVAIEPRYDVNHDTRAIQESSLRKQVAAEIGTQTDPEQPLAPIDLHHPNVQAAIQTLHDRLTHKGLLKRMAAKLEKTPEGFYAEAQEALTTSISVTNTDLQALAQARASAIQTVLTQAGIRPEQINMRSPAAIKAEHDAVTTTLTLETAKH